MTTLQTTVLADGFIFLEGPRWRDGRLWLSDMNDHKVYCVGMNGEREVVADVPAKPSGIGFLPDGTPLVVSMADKRVNRLQQGRLSLHADLSALAVGETNDMVVDQAGIAYVGNHGFDLHAKEKFRPSVVIMVTPDGKAGVVADQMRFPNGMAITPDGRSLVVAETFGRRLSIFDRAADGSLGHRRFFAELPNSSPDGICMDAEGCVWVADVNQHCFVRVRDGGTITHRVETGDRHAIACQLGGPDGHSLFCLTTGGGMENFGTKHTHSRIEVTQAPAPGAGSP